MTSLSEPKPFTPKEKAREIHAGRGPQSDMDRLMRRRIADRIAELGALPLGQRRPEELRDLHNILAQTLGGTTRPARGWLQEHRHYRMVPGKGRVELSRAEFLKERAERKRAKRPKRIKLRDVVIGKGLQKRSA